jgi:hypothetical protein
VLGGFGGASQFMFNQRSDKPAYAQQSQGSWSSGQNCTITPIHSALLPSGKIFYLAGSRWSNAHQFGPFEARVLDYNTGSEKNLTQSKDLFCVGQTGLPNGNILLAGGTLMYPSNPDNCNGRWHGLNAAFEFDFNSESLNEVSPMKHGRWYPTLVTLPDGKVWTCQGYDEYGSSNRIIEVYNPSTKSWAFIPSTSTSSYCVGQAFASTCPGAGSPCYTGPIPSKVSFYPRTHLMPNGQLIICGFYEVIYSWNPANGGFTNRGTTSTYRNYGTSFLCPLQNTTSEKGKILIVGGAPGSSEFAVTTCEILDFNASSTSNPVVRQVSPLAYRRLYLAPVILPDGKLLVLGGSERSSSVPVYIPEIFDPVTETWNSNLPPSSVPRVYHQVALLLPDGRVWNAGGMPSNGVWELRTQFFSPGYLFAGSRPTISGVPTVGNYGGTITIPTPGASAINSVSLLRLMNTTHHYDANQRLVWLQITNRGSSSITVSAPINANIAPPGYYMIHILNASNVPSVARIILIPGSGQGGGGDTTPPSQVTGLTATAASSTQIDLSWNPNPTADGVASYNIYRGTTAGFTVIPGTTPPTATSNTNSYSNTGLTQSTTYYFRVAAVDAAGNIGLPSSESSATTTGGGGGTVFYNVVYPGNAYSALGSGLNIRAGEQAATISSLLVGKSLRSWKVRLRRRGTPSGAITARVRRNSDDQIVASFNETINSTTLPTSFAEYTFTLTTPYTLALGDKIMIEYGGPSAVDLERMSVDAFDASNTRLVRFTTLYAYSGSQDITGSMSS